MGKDAYWFKHDAGAAFDPKILRIRAMFGWEGYGIYFGILEILRQQNGYKYKKNDSELALLATLLGIEETKFKKVFRECINVNLLDENDEFFFSKSLVIRMKEWEKQKKNGRKPKRKPLASQTQANSKPNGSIRGEESKEEERRGNEMPPSCAMVEKIFEEAGLGKTEGEVFYLNVRGSRGWDKINNWVDYTMAAVKQRLLKQNGEPKDPNAPIKMVH